MPTSDQFTCAHGNLRRLSLEAMTEGSNIGTYRKFGRPLLFGLVSLIALGVFVYMGYRDIKSVEQLPAVELKVNDTPPQTSPEVDEQSKSAHIVPPLHPRYLKIEKLNLLARIISVGKTKDGALDAPMTAWDVGWYKDGGQPGQDGAMLIDGHVNDSFNTPGIFASLNALEDGDLMTVERGDGQVYTYRVAHIEVRPVALVDMTRLLSPITKDKQGLNLITCGGTYNRKTGTYSDRILVYTERV